MVQSRDTRGIKIWIWGCLPEGDLIGAVDLQVTSEHPVHLQVVSTSYLYAIPTCAREHLFEVVDLCCGLGGFTHLLSRVGMHLRFGVDQNERWEHLFKLLHPQDAKFLKGDINELGVLRELVSAGCFHGVLCAGISCNGHSAMGDQLGMQDPRSMSLPKALQTAYMLQAACFVLECTPAIMRDPAAQEIIRKYAQATGYRVTQSLVQLSKSWCARRERWFGFFCAPLLGMCTLHNMPDLSVMPMPGDLMPELKVWPKFEQDQLVLNLYELSKYHAFATGGIQACYFKKDGKLPTLLHSAGNALYTCSCGCRAALSDARLQARGLIGVLIPLGTFERHMNIDMQHCRYLHPLEMWCLMGGLPDVSFGYNLRLAMSGIGQCVAPMVGLWIFAQIRQHLDGFLEIPKKVCPFDVLHAYALEVKQKCGLVWNPPVPPTIAEEAIEDESPRLTVSVVWPTVSDAVVKVSCPVGVAGGQILAAETSLGTMEWEVDVTADGEPMDLQGHLVRDTLITVVPKGWDVKKVVESEKVACCLEIANVPSESVSVPTVSYDVPVTNLVDLQHARVLDWGREQRVATLSRQGPVWGDDELLFWLNTVAGVTDPSQNVVVWDPLLVSGLVVSADQGTWNALTVSLGSVATVISAVACDRHWFPLVWRIDQLGVKLFTCGVAEPHAEWLSKLAAVVGLGRTGSPGAWTSRDLGFVVTQHCGAMAIAFIRHLLVESPCPISQAEVNVVAGELRLGFERCLGELCVRPRLAALGQVDFQALQELLVSHGVASAEAKTRAQSLASAVGEGDVVAAMGTSNVWRELKWRANQLRPPFIIVKPSELQAQIQKRNGVGTVGQKKHKQPKGKGKGGNWMQSPVLDPTRLRIEHGLLQSTEGLPLSQVALPQVGTNVQGVVLTTGAMAAPYVQAAKVLSTGALAFFVIDSVQPLSGIPSEVMRLPLVCVENSEPLLVEGLLIQLGACQVVRPVSKAGCAVNSVATCVVKAMVFRDMVSIPWEQVIAHPLQYVVQRLGPLQVCEDEECQGCEAWHASAAYPVDTPILEVWGRQWMKQTFVYSSPDDADIYAVHLRVPEALQVVLQEFSGDQGVFVEPKSVCGRKPSGVFQVIWTPKASLSQLIIQRQTLPEVCGVARLGNKLGLRCKVEHAASLSAKIRPEQVYLPQGEKLTFLVGPMPYGTLRSSLSQALKECGWVVRPLQPVSTRSSVPGLMFRVQAIEEPPQKVLRMSHGDVVVTRETEAQQLEPEKPSVVATQATVSKVSADKQVDELQINDPWAKPVAKGSKPAPASIHIGSPLDDMEQRVINAVLAQMPKQTMEVDSEVSVDSRVELLEQQVHDMQNQTQTLHATVKRQGAEQEQQIQEVRAQIAQQGSHFEAALANQSGQLQTFQESFREQFRQQTAHQQTMLDSMFQQQMHQFESLLAKRHKPE